MSKCGESQTITVLMDLDAVWWAQADEQQDVCMLSEYLPIHCLLAARRKIITTRRKKPEKNS